METDIFAAYAGSCLFNQRFGLLLFSVGYKLITAVVIPQDALLEMVSLNSQLFFTAGSYFLK